MLGHSLRSQLVKTIACRNVRESAAEHEAIRQAKCTSMENASRHLPRRHGYATGDWRTKPKYFLVLVAPPRGDIVARLLTSRYAHLPTGRSALFPRRSLSGVLPGRDR